MTSKISSFSIAKEDLRHRAWMLALSCLGSLLSLPVLFLLANRSYLNSYTGKGAERLSRLPIVYANFFSGTSMVSQGFILFIGAGIVAILGFRYLYSRKMVDLYHALPVKRSRLFLITYINGLLIWLVPMLLSVLLTLIIMFANLAACGIPGTFGSVFITAMSTIPTYLIAFLTVYHLCLVCVMLSGNAINALCSSAIIGTIAVIVYAIILEFSGVFFDTFVDLNIRVDQVVWASPLVSPIYILSDGTYVITDSGIQLSESGFTNAGLFYTYCLLMILFLFFAAYQLYKKRPSELAEHGVDSPVFQSILRICGAFVAAMCGAIIFRSILDKEAIGWQLFGIVLCGGFAFGVLDIILHMNFRSFFLHKLQMAITVIVSGLFLLLFVWDFVGYDTRLPDKSDIATASVSLSRFRDSNWDWEFDKNGIGYYSEDESPMDYRDIDTLYPLLETLAQEEHQIIGQYVTSTNIELTLKSGEIFKRRYYLYESDVDALRKIVNSDEFRTAWYPVSSGLYPTPKSLQVHSDLVYAENLVNSPDHIREILNAYYSDFKSTYSLDYLLNDIQVGTLYLNYDYSHGNTKNTSTIGVSLEIYESFHQTIAKIKEYYPEIVLERSLIQLTRVEFATENLIEEGIIRTNAAEEQKEADAAEMAKSTTVVDVGAEAAAVIDVDSKLQYVVTAENKYDDEIVLTDPETITKLVPYLHLGSSSNNPFSSLDQYKYFGSAMTDRGHHLSCYVAVDELPLDLSEILP